MFDTFESSAWARVWKRKRKSLNNRDTVELRIVDTTAGYHGAERTVFQLVLQGVDVVRHKHNG